MTTATEWRSTRSGVALLLALVALAATRPVHPQCPDTGRLVIINRKAVPSKGAENLLDLLGRHVSPFRLGLQTASSDARPAVLIDGVLTSSGLETIASLPSRDVDSVIVLRPPDAVSRLGVRGGSGAIVVTTRRGGPGTETGVRGHRACLLKKPNSDQERSSGLCCATSGAPG